MMMLGEMASGMGIGLLLGLLGGGGALIAIPVLIYLFGYPFKMAVGSSLALVTAGALPSVILYWRKKRIDWLAAILMGIFGALGTTLGHRMATVCSKEMLLGILLVLMGFSALSMLKPQVPSVHLKKAPVKLSLAGLAIGVLTGLVGVGGGFLLVPALILFAQLEVRTAIATSLVIIFLNALSGTMAYLAIIPHHHLSFWFLLGGSLIGSVLGFLGSFRMSAEGLKRGFATLLFALMALLILFPPGK